MTRPRPRTGGGRESATRTVLPWWLAALLVAVGYGPALGRGFVSDDFVLLRYLGDFPAWERGATLFTTPWLGVETSGLYRPLGELVLSSERWLFGVSSSLPYEALQLLLHLGNVAVVAALTRRLLAAPPPAPPAQGVALWAALLFGLYPFHPIAVLSVADSSVLLANTAALLALWLWVRLRTGGHPLEGLLALLAFAVGLFAYEGVLVLAAIVPLVEILCLGLGRGSLLVTVAVWLLPAAGYLAARAVALGTTVSEAPAFESLLALAGPTASSAFGTLAALPYPDTRPWLPADVAVVALVWLLPAAIGTAVCLRRRDPIAGTLVVAPLWVLLAVSPIALRVVEPSDGRYWYLASAGLALFGAALVSAAGRRGRHRGALAAVVVVVLVAAWLPGLVAHLAQLRVAGTRAERARAILFERVAPGERAFVTGHPRFVKDRLDRDAAPVLDRGLHDALMVPFTPADREIYPLPPADDANPAAALSRERVLFYEDSVSSPFAPSFVPEAALPLLPILEPADQGWADATTPVVVVALAPSTADESFVGPPRPLDRPPPRPTRARVVVVTPGASSVTLHDLTAGADSAEARLPLPRELLIQQSRLYRKPDAEPPWHFVWIEGLDSAGKAVAVSPMRAFRLRP